MSHLINLAKCRSFPKQGSGTGQTEASYKPGLTRQVFVQQSPKLIHSGVLPRIGDSCYRRSASRTIDLGRRSAFRDGFVNLETRLDPPIGRRLSRGQLVVVCQAPRIHNARRSHPSSDLVVFASALTASSFGRLGLSGEEGPPLLDDAVAKSALFGVDGS